jgi:predicted aconitase with swiveling domain
MIILPAQILLEGEAEGPLTRWSAPLSFWGGYDAAASRVIDRTHPAFGETIAGAILAMPSGRGSGSASSVLAEAIRLGNAPAAILLGASDPIIGIGAIVAARLYGKVCPVAVCEVDGLGAVEAGAMVRIVARNSRLVLILPGEVWPNWTSN